MEDAWKDRLGKMQCQTCMWFVEKDVLPRIATAVMGRCRRHAPTMSGYPVVFPHDWCGDHKLDENKG